MSRRTYIALPNEYLSPEHRQRLGIRLWLYLHIRDKANWEAGYTYGWKDKDEAEDFGMPWRTLQEHRQQLEADGYITCHQRGGHQDIEIHNWVNPREYSGRVYNTRQEGTETSVPSIDNAESTENPVPPDMPYPAKGTGQSTGQSSRKSRTPTYSSKNQESKDSTKNLESSSSSSSPPLAAAGSPPTPDPENARALAEYWQPIGEPVRSELASLPPDYLAGMLAWGEAQQTPAALLIHKLRGREPVPRHAARPDPDDRGKYRAGEYAEFVQS